MSDYHRVCAIDAGTRNFAFCFMDNLDWRQPVNWRKQDLWAPMPKRATKPTLQDVIYITYTWCMQNKTQLDECDSIVLETQLRKPFIVMNTVIQTLFYNKTVVVSPMTIAAYFKLPKTRDAKKAAGVALVQRYAVLHGDKIDDLADAWMMAAWQMINVGALSATSF